MELGTFGTVGLWDYGAVGLWGCETGGLGAFGAVGLWGRGAVGLWGCETVGLWDWLLLSDPCDAKLLSASHEVEEP